MLSSKSTEFLFQHFKRSIEINEDEALIISQAFSHVKLKKKKDLLRAGETCKRIFLIEEGSARSYQIDQKGNEQIYQIAFENNWISDLYSFLSQNASDMYVETIEASEVLYIDLESLEDLYIKVPKLERFFRILFQNAYIASLNRIYTSKSAPAEIRYQELIKKQPQLISRVPLIYIASYLGITPESLSRIRRQLL